MKKLFYFALALVCSTLSYAQDSDDWRIPPDEAKYKIFGYFETTFPNGEISFELTKVKPEGISFPVKTKYYGGQTTRGNVFFQFDHVTCNDGKPDFDNIALWVYDEAEGKWRADYETGKREKEASNTNEMTVMLVLDCSSSLKRKGSNGFAESGFPHRLRQSGPEAQGHRVLIRSAL